MIDTPWTDRFGNSAKAELTREALQIVMDEAERHFNPNSPDYIGGQDSFIDLEKRLKAEESGVSKQDLAGYYSTYAYQLLHGLTNTPSPEQWSKSPWQGREQLPKTLIELEARLTELCREETLDNYLQERVPPITGLGGAEILHKEDVQEALNYIANDILQSAEQAMSNSKGNGRA